MNRCLGLEADGAFCEKPGEGSVSQTLILFGNFKMSGCQPPRGLQEGINDIFVLLHRPRAAYCLQILSVERLAHFARSNCYRIVFQRNYWIFPLPSRNNVLVRTSCCTFGGRQSDAGRLIADDEWELATGSFLKIIWPSLSCGREVSATQRSVSTRSYVQCSTAWTRVCSC